MAGRPTAPALRRVIAIVAVLSAAGDAGVTATRLMDAVGMAGDSRLDVLSRELRQLRAAGWVIDNLAPEGSEAVYRMTPGDTRLRLHLGPEQQLALERAVLVRRGRVSTGPAAHDDETATLTALLTAIRTRSRVTLRYKGLTRTLDPGSVAHQNDAWYLTGREVGQDAVKTYRVQAVTDISLDASGTALAVPEPARLTLHPLLWEIDEPVEVTVSTLDEHLPEVWRWLAEPVSTVSADGRSTLTYRVTNREAFRSRLYLLGTRVDVLGPEAFRDELLTELAEMAGES